eukprot:scaffold180823_cov15-Prasinocladus_malaysianus.AAC.1
MTTKSDHQLEAYAVREDAMRQEFQAWVDDNRLEERDDRPTYMMPIPKVKESEQEHITEIIE